MIRVDPDGKVIIQFDARIRPKGSHTAIVSKSTGRAIVIDQDRVGKKIEEAIRKELKAECAALGIKPLTGPLMASGRVWFTRPKSTTQDFPFTLGDLEKLVRRLFDILGGNRADPGPVLTNDNQIVSFGQWHKVWADSDGAILVLEPVRTL